MEPQKSGGEGTPAKPSASNPISDWLPKVAGWGAFLAVIAGTFFPVRTPKLIAWSNALALGALWAVLAYRRRRRRVLKDRGS